MICLHLASGNTAHACAQHLTLARQDLAANDTVISVARCSDQEGDCAWC